MTQSNKANNVCSNRCIKIFFLGLIPLSDVSCPRHGALKDKFGNEEETFESSRRRTTSVVKPKTYAERLMRACGNINSHLIIIMIVFK